MRQMAVSSADLEPEEFVRRMLERDEDQWFDRKSSRTQPRDLANAILAMANAEGGVLVVGVHGGRIEGVDAQGTSAENGWRQAAIDFGVPPPQVQCSLVPCVDANGAPNHVFVVDVAASSEVHANRRDEVFLRVGDESKKLSFAQRRELMYEKGQAHFEVAVVRDATESDLDRELLDNYARACGAPSPSRLLRARGLVTPTGAVTVGAYLLFAPHPQDRFPEAYVRILRYRGSARGAGARQQLSTDRRCEGPIPHQLDTAMDAIAEQIPSRSVLGRAGRFERLSIVPRDAWLEALVNAVIHRSYSMTGDHIRVEVFDDRVEVASPGRFPGLVDLSEPTEVSRFARNPRIARACAELHYGQELGEGVRRIFEEMRLHDLEDPEFVQTAGSVHVVLRADLRLGYDTLSDFSLAVVRFLRENGPSTTSEILASTDVSRPTLLKRLRRLETDGHVVWEGESPRDPTAIWRVPS